MRMFPLVILASTAIACGGGPATPSTTAALVNTNGSWTGTTSQGTTITFSITNSRLITLDDSVRFGPECSGFIGGVEDVVSGGGTTDSIPSTAGVQWGHNGNFTTLRGQFTSSTAADGTVSWAYNADVHAADGQIHHCTSSGSVTWSATKTG